MSADPAPMDQKQPAPHSPAHGSRQPKLSPHKEAIRRHSDRLAEERTDWIKRNEYFHQEDMAYLRFLVPPGAKVLLVGCGAGDLLPALDPSEGVGMDLSAAMIAVAEERFPGFTWVAGDAEDPDTLDALPGPFDYIILPDLIGHLEDCQSTLERLHGLCHADTRIILAYHSPWWGPILRLAELIGQKMPDSNPTFLASADIENLLALAGFETVKREPRQLLPKRWFGIGPVVNHYIATLPLIRKLCLRRYLVARSLPKAERGDVSVTVLIPCRNERGNIEPAIQRMPRFGSHQEILFVEGNSSDGTYVECERVRDHYGADWDIRVMKQPGKGKGDAVRAGFDAARGDILMILDADLTVPPEDLPKFYRALVGGAGTGPEGDDAGAVAGAGEFINGTRLVYPMHRGAMRFLNLLGNRFFALLFSFLLNHRFTDTLCGTKVLRRRHYQRITANRAYFGDFDPFGDFDLIFGAAKLNLKIAEVPIRYADRTYGETQISRFRDGWLLLRMVAFAWRKLKVIGDDHRPLAGDTPPAKPEA